MGFQNGPLFSPPLGSVRVLSPPLAFRYSQPSYKSYCREQSENSHRREFLCHDSLRIPFLRGLLSLSCPLAYKVLLFPDFLFWLLVTGPSSLFGVLFKLASVVYHLVFLLIFSFWAISLSSFLIIIPWK